MKKINKFIIMLIFFIFLSFCLPVFCFAIDDFDTMKENADSFILEGKKQGGSIFSDTELQGFALPIGRMLVAVATVIVIIVTIILGIQYMMANPSDKANLKKKLIGLVVSIIVIYGAQGIWAILYHFMSEQTVSESRLAAVQETDSKTQSNDNNKQNSNYKNNNEKSNSDKQNSNNQSSNNSDTSSSSSTNNGQNKNESGEKQNNNTEEDKEKKNVTQLLSTIGDYSKQIEKDYKAGKYWEYSNNKRSLGEKRTHNSFADAKKGARTTNCARIVFWAFYDLGITKQKEDIYSNASGELKAKDSTKKRIEKFAKIIRVNKTPNQLKREGNLKPGDICLYPGHTNIYIGNNKWYDAGRGSGVGNAYSYKTVNGNAIYRFKTVGPCESRYVDKTATYIIRLKDQT